MNQQLAALADQAPPRRAAAAHPPTEEQLDQVLERIAAGDSLRAICRELGLVETTVRSYLALPDRAGAWSRARAAKADRLVDETLEIVDEPGLLPADVPRARLRVSSRQWIASKLDPARFGERVQVEQLGPGAMSDDELGRRLGQLLERAGAAAGPGGQVRLGVQLTRANGDQAAAVVELDQAQLDQDGDRVEPAAGAAAREEEQDRAGARAGGRGGVDPFRSLRSRSVTPVPPGRGPTKMSIPSESLRKDGHGEPVPDHVVPPLGGTCREQKVMTRVVVRDGIEYFQHPDGIYRPHEYVPARSPGRGTGVPCETVAEQP